ncbi:hypothetical protein F4820DRAFT_467324 [Hypoxylon rubiginosum]|uniref:Uncharacterized protein n=1 Tax=Hypoxylon rubiginosum TaxID=110542 RepID=A0ACB9YIA3_9PEZI|nr:hypothetical protein F4820DRAFT_467324 [Hypoxylon rubiginosum]
MDALMHVSRTLVELNDFSQAAPLVKEALEREEQVSGPDDLACLPIRIFLGEIMHALSDSEQAAEVFSKVAVTIQATEDIRKLLTCEEEIFVFALFSRSIFEAGRVDESEGNAGNAIALNKTLSPPGCPVFDTFPSDFRKFLQKIQEASVSENQEPLAPRAILSSEQSSSSTLVTQPSSTNGEQETQKVPQPSVKSSPKAELFREVIHGGSKRTSTF